MNTEKKSIELTDAEFAGVLKSPRPVLVDFWAEWCGPCKMIGPLIEELAKDYTGKADIYKLNIDDNSTTPSTYSIRSIPTIIIFKNGEPVERMVGAVSRAALEEKLDKYIS